MEEAKKFATHYKAFKNFLCLKVTVVVPLDQMLWFGLHTNIFFSKSDFSDQNFGERFRSNILIMWYNPDGQARCTG